jgi:hypothetical protein
LIYLYAVGDVQDGPADVSGLDDEPLLTVNGEGVTAFASRLADLELEANESALWKHEEVVEALMEQGTVLPFRFGSTLPNIPAVRAMLVERGAELSAGLERVRGAVELGIRVLGEPAVDQAPRQTSTMAGVATSASPGPGATYLLQRLGRRQEVDRLVERVHEPLAALARESQRRQLRTSPLLLSGAYLVDRDSVEAFRKRVEELDEENTASILCTGPWPPYGFSSPADERS